jgi:hypothetical protein
MICRLSFLRLFVLIAVVWAVFSGFLRVSQTARAQDPARSSRSQGENHDERRSWRSRFSDRGREDWRSNRSRNNDERRGNDSPSEDRSGSSSPANGATGSTRSSTSASSTTATSGPLSSSGASSGIDLKSWATKLVAKNDKNGNMILEPDEQGFLGSAAASEDLDHDGKITIDELVLHHSAGAPAASPQVTTRVFTATGKDSDQNGQRRFSSGDNRSKIDAETLSKRVLTGSVGAVGSAGKEPGQRRSYRFSRAADKLPAGLPGWFRSRDTNGDGQVSMSEYSRSWSASAVADFRRFDLNDDGIVTPKEAAKVK